MATFAEDQVTRLETLLAANVGVVEVHSEGKVIRYDDLLKQYDFWKSKVAVESGSRPRAMNVDLSGF